MAVIAPGICEQCNQETLGVPQSAVLSAEIGQVDWVSETGATHT